jgi:predicted CXXCH cytochrome family protein
VERRDFVVTSKILKGGRTMFEKNLEKSLEKGASGFVLLGPIFGLLYIFLLPIIGITTLLLALPEYASAKKAPIIENAEICMSCHSMKGVDKVFRNKEKVSVFVNAEDFKDTVHGFLSCDSCHAKISLETHPGTANVFESRSAFALDAARACIRCHSSEQLKAKPHHAAMTNRPNAPPCTECHGAHTVKRASVWKPTLAGNQYCLTCHSKNFSKTERNGDKLSLHIDPSLLSSSVHNKHACNDCHTEYSRASHPVKSFGSNREHSIKVSEACRKCHADKQKAVSESIHYKLMSEGNQYTPVCTDCHGFHTVGPKATYETMSGVPCKKCHDKIFEIYSKSVHGMAKASGEHKAPICSSCHFAHDVTVANLTDKIKNVCLGCHKGVEAVHEKWLPNSGLHLSVVACAACHSPKSGRGISLRLYDQNTGKPFTEEQIMKLLGTSYQGLSEKMNAHGEGINSDDLWSIVSQLNKKGAEAKVTFLGRMQVSDGSESHMLTLKKNAVRECESCHTSNSNFFRTVTVAIVKADGRLKEYKVQPEVLGSMMSLASLKQFYVLGSTRLKILDWIGILMVFGGMSVPVLHITFRILTSPIREAKRLNKMRKGDRP